MQALTMLYVPLSLWMIVAVKVPVAVAMISMLPLYLLVVQCGISLAGLYEFTSVHGLRPSPWSPVWLAISYLPFQWLLGYSALRAIWRTGLRNTSWEKTQHVGAHRVEGLGSSPAQLASGRLASEDVTHG